MCSPQTYFYIRHALEAESKGHLRCLHAEFRVWPLIAAFACGFILSSWITLINLAAVKPLMCCFDSRFPQHYEITLRSPNSCVVMGSSSRSALIGPAFCVTSHHLNWSLLPFSFLFSGGSSEELEPRKHRGQKLSHIDDSRANGWERHEKLLDSGKREERMTVVFQGRASL